MTAETTEGNDERTAILAALGDRYQIVRHIGSGGMGVVFLARDTRLHRMVAIKVLRLERAADPDRRNEFLREARLTAHLQHPGVVPVYDIIESPGAVGVVMPFAGDSLATHLVRRGGRLSVAEVCTLMLDIVGTLAFVHRSGVLHRDLKPENVLLEPGHDRLHARLTDFGIAIVPLRDYGITGQPVAAGTPGFVSPEQIFSVVDTDRRSDIYALGVLAYRLCAGTLPFGDTQRAPQQRPSRFTPLSEAAPEIPKDFARIVERCLAVDPTDRWPDAATLYLQLDRYARSVPAPATPVIAEPPLDSSAFFRNSRVVLSPLTAMSGLFRDAWRSLRRAPAFSALVVGTLALGIGANATMLAVLDELVIRPPRQVRNAEELYSPSLTIRRPGNEYTNTVHSYPVFNAMHSDTNVFAHVAMFASTSMSLGTGENAKPVTVMSVSGDYFPLFGTQPLRGRLLLPDDDAEPSGSPVAVVSEPFWRTTLGRRADVVGQTLLLNNARFTIVGVAPNGFAGTRSEFADVWLPVGASPTDMTSYPKWRTNNAIWMSVVARVRPKISPEQAASAATASVRAIYTPTSAEGKTATVGLVPAQPRLDGSMQRESKVALLLAAVSIFVLLTACANVTNITLARNIRRASDLTVRQVLGITRGRLASMLLVESVILAAIGGALALAIMYIGGPLLLRFLQDNPNAQLNLDLRTAGIAFAISLVAAIAAGLAPALSIKEDFGSAMRAGARSLSRGNRTARYALLGVQCASCAMLLAGSGLFARSLHNIDTLKLGFDPEVLWSGQISLSHAGFDEPRSVTLMHDLRDRAARIPGVTQVTLANNTPLSYWGWSLRVRVPGLDSLPRFKDGGPYFTSVGAEYFATIGAHIVRGRGITTEDRAGGTPVIVINQSIAKTWFPGQDPIGRCIFIGADGTPCSAIVGIVEDVRRQQLVEDFASAMIYIPIEQRPADVARSMLLVRVAPGTDPSSALRKMLQTAAPGLPYATVTPLEDSVAERAVSWRLGRALFTAFGALALVIAAIGIYGVFSFAVAQRKREIGIRIALGALSHRVLGMVLGEGVLVGLAGAVVGIIAVYAASPLIAPLLFRVDPADPVILFGATATVAIIAVLACLVPARRATKVEPMVAIRSE